jgi:Fe-S-cluster-containing dehydrogenase component
MDLPTPEERNSNNNPEETLQHGCIFVTDKSICTGCRNCELVCSLYHEGACSSSLARIHVAKDIFSGDYDMETCIQCKNARCLEACPVEGALTIDAKTGAKIIDISVSIGCRACLETCIFAKKMSRIKYDEKRNVCLKCDLCTGDPQCVKVCPENILVFRSFK